MCIRNVFGKNEANRIEDKGEEEVIIATLLHELSFAQLFKQLTAASMEKFCVVYIRRFQKVKFVGFEFWECWTAKFLLSRVRKTFKPSGKTYIFTRSIISINAENRMNQNKNRFVL